MRINKYIASAGVTSRRKADELIEAGKVKVNGVVMTSLGYHVEDGDVVEVQGSVVKPANKFVYYLLNKPTGYVTSTYDKEGRPVVTELVPDEIRVFPVGRLDFNTSGLLILTNDGELSNRLMHPRNEFDKTYVARVKGTFTRALASRLARGVDIGGFVTSPAEVKVLKQEKNSSVVEITIHEGKNRQVRRMFEAVGFEVVELERVRLGNLQIGRLAPGKFRKLSPAEVEMLKKA